MTLVVDDIIFPKGNRGFRPPVSVFITSFFETFRSVSLTDVMVGGRALSYFPSMETLQTNAYESLDMKKGIWDHVFTVAPLVVIGSKEKDGYDLAPKHMAAPLGFGNYFGFICTPRHGTYHNIRATGEFAVSFPKPGQIVPTSLTATPRKGVVSKSEKIVTQLPVVRATTMDVPLIENAYLYLECELYKIVDGFDDYSLITGKIRTAYVDQSYLRISDMDEQQQLRLHPLLAYVANGRFASVENTYNFPFPKDFKR